MTSSPTYSGNRVKYMPNFVKTRAFEAGRNHATGMKNELWLQNWKTDLNDFTTGIYLGRNFGS